MAKKIKLFLFLFILFISSFSRAQNYHILEETSSYIKMEVDFSNAWQLSEVDYLGKKVTIFNGKQGVLRQPGDPNLPGYHIALAIPFNSKPTISILSADKISYLNKFIMPAKDELDSTSTSDFYSSTYYADKRFPEQPATLVSPFVMRYSKVLGVNLSPFQYNPVSKELTFSKKITFIVEYNPTFSTGYVFQKNEDKSTLDFINNTVINKKFAKDWMGKAADFTANKDLVTDWYNPTKDYFKVYFKNKDVYKITFEQLVAAGVPLGNGVNSRKLEMFGNGAKIPIDVYDGGDSLFSAGDYIKFVGYAVPASPYCTEKNLYNLSNTYWFSYQADTVGARYKNSNGVGPYNLTVQSIISTDHYEVDTIYENLGYADDGKRDHWFWGKASNRDGTPYQNFQARFKTLNNWNQDEPVATIRVGLQGITTNSFTCDYMHSAKILINDKEVAKAKWNEQKSIVAENKFYIGPDSIIITSDGNYVTVMLDGDICLTPKNDEARVNYFELDYWSKCRADVNKYFFKSVAFRYGSVRYWTWNWKVDTVDVYIPVRNKKINNLPLAGDADSSMLFVDTVYTPTDYFCVGKAYGSSVDSIIRDKASDLKNVANQANYLVITHPKFTSVANRLANFRKTHYPDTTVHNPSTMVVDVFDIYDQFSDGLMTPSAIKSFIKYAFENYRTPPTFVVLVGDLSHDYRQILPGSRPNYMPSMPYHTIKYGEAASDNDFVCIAGDDVIPDLSIGRISIEEVFEGNNILDKIEAYPADNGKKWKETFQFMASGLSEDDARSFGFNSESLSLYNNMVVPNGLDAQMMFNYPTNALELKYKGSTQEIINGFNSGTVLANYYGHGGGYQWDLTFLNEDIYQLQNEGRLPFILSLTCYTAHFDNQDVFGEQFMKVPNKGAIGFFGSSGLTYWLSGKEFGKKLYDIICNNKVNVAGTAVQMAKAASAGGVVFDDQLQLFTYFGDPALTLTIPTTPDYSIKSSGITISNLTPLIGDTVQVKLYPENSGILNAVQQIRVDLYSTVGDSTKLIESKLIPSFGNKDSVTFNWVPLASGLTVITAKINMRESVYEADFSDNVASTSLPVFNLSDPVVIRPQDGISTDGSSIKIEIADGGVYVRKNLEYYIEIDTTQSFGTPIIQSGKLSSNTGLITYNTPTLPAGGYYWRARIFDGTNYGRWSVARSFIIHGSKKDGYFVNKNILKNLVSDNLHFDATTQSLNLNTGLLPPKPMNDKLIEEFSIAGKPSLDTIGLTCIATDGKFYYLADQWYNALRYDITGKTHIYRIGTGKNGTVKGGEYGAIPGFYDQIRIQYTYHSDGHLLIPFVDPYKLIRVNTSNDLIDTIGVSAGLWRYDDAKSDSGYFWLASDGNYVYNLAKKDTLGKKCYAIRIFDPNNNWNVVADKYYLTLVPYTSLSGFFIADDRFYLYENYYSGFMRRVQIENGTYEGEWITWTSPNPWEYIRFHSWCYDKEHDLIYTAQYRRGDTLTHTLATFAGKYLDATGSVMTSEVGPGYKWNKATLAIETPNAASQYSAKIFGLNTTTKLWDTVGVTTTSTFDLSGVKASKYRYLKMKVDLKDTSFSTGTPMKVQSLGLEYDSEFPEVVLNPADIHVATDSLLQGRDFTIRLKVSNIAKNNIDSCLVKFYLDGADTAFYKTAVSIPADSSVTIEKVLNSSSLIFNHNLQAIASLADYERVSSNNITTGTFYVARDSVKPTISITFDGKEILNGDIISKVPSIKIALADDSPLPINYSNFTLILDSDNITKASGTIDTAYTPYPNSRFEITFKPILKEGRHTLDVLAKDATNNFFDTTYHRNIFYVYDQNDMARVMNYPNPFANDTYFTFELRGAELPDLVTIRIFTIAGRLIKEIKVPQSALNIGLSKCYWDGRDQDGDEIANGVYLYKVIANYAEKTKVFTEKLVKMK